MVPQAPQLAPSAVRSRHVPEQLVWFVTQLTPPPPPAPGTLPVPPAQLGPVQLPTGGSAQDATTIEKETAASASARGKK
jgi:hypothetical protein